jgi:hypothetical protein
MSTSFDNINYLQEQEMKRRDNYDKIHKYDRDKLARHWAIEYERRCEWNIFFKRIYTEWRYWCNAHENIWRDEPKRRKVTPSEVMYIIYGSKYNTEIMEAASILNTLKRKRE